jgi:hypothetical protein
MTPEPLTSSSRAVDGDKTNAQGRRNLGTSDPPRMPLP